MFVLNASTLYGSTYPTRTKIERDALPQEED